MDKAISHSSASAHSILNGGPLKEVTLGLQALLKIMQHARESQPQAATGQLLGMESDSILEVTDMFPFAAAIQDEMEQENYQLGMIKSLRDVNVDHNTVGWYQTCSLDGFISPALVEAQLNYQATIPNSIVIIYDHLQSTRGPPAIRALRLRADFISLYRDKRAKYLANHIGMHIFDDLPLKIKLSALEKLFLAQLSNQGEIPTTGSIAIPEADELVSKTIAESMLAAAEDVLAESGKMQHYIRTVSKQQQVLSSQLQRLKSENAQRAESGLDPLPASSVISNFRMASEPSRMPCLISSSNLHILIDSYQDNIYQGGAAQSSN